MRKLKIYLDTSVISHLDAYDAQDKQVDTLLLWEEIKSGKYKVFISDIVFEEIYKNLEIKRELLLKYLTDIEYQHISIDDDIRKYADELNRLDILSEKHISDCLHIGSAVIYDCDMLLSWNFKHMVRIKTINGVKSVNSLLGYKEIGIYPPSMIIERGEE